MLSDELGVLVDKLNDLGRPVRHWLVRGSSPSRIEKLLGPHVPGEVVAWFGWCDGVEVHPGQTQDDINIIPGYFPISLKEAVEGKSLYEGDPVLGENWIPVLRGGGGDIYAAVWGPGQNPSVAGVLDGEPTEIEFPGLERMVSFFNECFLHGVFYAAGSGHLQMNPEQYDELYSDFFA